MKKLFFTVLAVASVDVVAELKPIADDELSQYSGQAAVAFDIDQIGSNSYTRVTLGMESKMQMNINNVELGKYERDGELGADFSATNLAFGSISTDAAQVQLDGQTYAVNDIIPFEVNDPYFEIDKDATDELVGFRLGFGEARGQLSGDFDSISGNVGATITDFFGDDYQASMLNLSGDVDNTRAKYFGVGNDQSGGATDCNSGFYCYDLADYKTLDVGQRNSTTGNVDYTNDFFISFQKEDTDWSTSDGQMTTASGVFINIPTSLHIDMNTGTNANGTERVRVEYIDRGVGLFKP
ncbi:hypothetical protein A3735_23515 [Oleiphilus sp. HI0061]|nr:hypothetical protein A3735_23515 [Oleiphilus sp. HI0061]